MARFASFIARLALLSLPAVCLLRAAPIELHPERTSPYDLAVTGQFAGAGAETTRYLSWSELRGLPVTQLEVDGEFVPGPQALTVIFLDDLRKGLPLEAGADVILATCTDGYVSVYTDAFVAKYRPFLVLEIDGKGPTQWPPKGLSFNPGPYAITVSGRLVPEAGAYRDLGHKKPWEVTSIEFASYAERFGWAYTGKWASLPAAGAEGRQIWVNSCASCHSGPAGAFGGTKSGRPFAVVAAYAAYDPTYFKRYVRNPKSLVPSAKMEPHPHYTDGELAELIAFITAGGS